MLPRSTLMLVHAAVAAVSASQDTCCSLSGCNMRKANAPPASSPSCRQCHCTHQMSCFSATCAVVRLPFNHLRMH
jgi:hypothetical protein